MRLAALALAALLATPIAGALRAAPVPADTLEGPVFRGLGDVDSAAVMASLRTPAPVESKSPGTALLLSALLPGAGQVYNESYWKVPIVLGGGLWIASEWLHYDRLVDEYRDRYEASITPDDPDGDPTLLSYREFYKDQRDEWALYGLLLYVVNLVDAYVDASLFDFTVSDDLALRVAPALGSTPGSVGLGLTLRLGR